MMTSSSTVTVFWALCAIFGSDWGEWRSKIDDPLGQDVKVLQERKPATSPEPSKITAPERSPGPMPSNFMSTQLPYTVAPPDILFIDTLRIIPKKSSRIGPLAVAPDSINIRGEYLVRQDGRISLGAFGSVYVAGMTVGQIKCVVERHLSEYLQEPQISVNVFSYNSKVYYVIVEGGAYGPQTFRLPITGNETVLDAVGRVNGLAAMASKRRMWLARPSTADGGSQILPIDWNAITMNASPATNYQILSGDRIYLGGHELAQPATTTPDR